MRRSFVGPGPPDAGAVTAELAIALPAVVVVLALGIGGLGAAARQVRLQDAVADAARIVARGDGAGRAVGVVTAAVPGADASIDDRGDLVCVRATTAARVLVEVPIAATACALAGGR